MQRINLKVLASVGGGTFDSLGPFGSGQGPHLMGLMHLKSWPWGPTLESFASVYAFDPEAPEGPGGA